MRTIKKPWKRVKRRRAFANYAGYQNGACIKGQDTNDDI